MHPYSRGDTFLPGDIHHKGGKAPDAPDHDHGQPSSARPAAAPVAALRRSGAGGGVRGGPGAEHGHANDEERDPAEHRGRQQHYEREKIAHPAKDGGDEGQGGEALGRLGPSHLRRRDGNSTLSQMEDG